MTPAANMDTFSPKFDAFRRDLKNIRRSSVKAASRVKNRAVSSAMPAANSSSFVRTLRNSFRRRKKPDLATELENDENSNGPENRNPAQDVKLTIKSNETTFVKLNVRTGMANYKCKFLGKMEVDGKSGIKYTDTALRSFKTLKERKKQRIIIQVNPEVIRVVSAKDSMLLFDQAVDKISFCAPSNVYPDAFSYIARDGASQRWLCYCFSAKNGVTGSTLSQVFGEAFKACLENRQRLQQETGQKPIDVQMETLDGGGFSRTGKGTFRQPKRKPVPNLIDTSNDVPIVEGEDEQSVTNVPNGTSFSSPNARPRPEAPARLVREASLRLPLKPTKNENTDPFKRSTSLRAYSNNTNRNNEIPAVKNWQDQLEAIKALNIQVHNPTPIVESSPSPSTVSGYSSTKTNSIASPAWEPLDPFNELANRPKNNPYGVMRQAHPPPPNVNNNNPFVQLDSEPKSFMMKF